MTIPSLERWLTGWFRSDAEASNFSAHLAWSMLVPLLCLALFGRQAGFYGGMVWLVYSLLNEWLVHGPEDAREMVLNLCARVVPGIVVLVVLAVT